MKLLFVVFADQLHGMGHFYRTMAVRDEALARGYRVQLAGNYQHDPAMYLERIDAKDRLDELVKFGGPDWLIIDILEPLPEYVVELAHKYHCRVALLNGIGRKDNGLGVDVLWAQDQPDKAILRPEIRALVPEPQEHTLVWGGAADELGLTSYYMRHMDDKAIIALTAMTTHETRESAILHGTRKPEQQVVTVSGDEIYEPLRTSRKVVAHLGMLCWEAAYLRVPMYIFARSHGHLADAKKFEDLGLACAWNGIGLPDSGIKFREFVGQEFMPTGEAPDGLGAGRFLDALR
jgi:spore coat polysaccharide biosynthesis predicted glycosyltransferase SpsG